MTPPDKPLERALRIDGKANTLTVTPTPLCLTEKGKLNGVVLTWKERANGDAALVAALRAMLG